MNLNIKTLLIDDHKIVREGLKRILDESDDINVIAEASNGDDAIRLIQNNVFDIIIIVNFILFGDEPDPFYLFKADLDKDGQVNIQDIILLLNLIL